jgi:hypothetical protein
MKGTLHFVDFLKSRQVLIAKMPPRPPPARDSRGKRKIFKLESVKQRRRERRLSENVTRL